MPKPDAGIGFIVEFTGPMLRDLSGRRSPWRRMFPQTPTARSSTRNSSRNPETGGMRLELHVRRIDETKPIELRAALRNGDEASETWSYALPPG